MAGKEEKGLEETFRIILESANLSSIRTPISVCGYYYAVQFLCHNLALRQPHLQGICLASSVSGYKLR